MNLIKWDPMQEFGTLRNELGRWFGHASNGGNRAIGDAWAPAVDIFEDDKAIVIKADLPEVDKKDVEVTLDHGVLTLKGERKLEKEEKKDNYTRIERSYGSFLRSFSLPDYVEADKIAADYTGGVLKLTLPKSQGGKPQPVKIPLN